MARRKDDGGGRPFFWLLLGFLCGVVGTLGALLLLSSQVTGTSGPAEPAAVEEASPSAGAGAPTVAPLPQSPPPLEAAPAPLPVPPPKGAPAPAAAPRAPAAPNTDAQIAEDAAASGMTARTR